MEALVPGACVAGGVGTLKAGFEASVVGGLLKTFAAPPNKGFAAGAADEGFGAEVAAGVLREGKEKAGFCSDVEVDVAEGVVVVGAAGLLAGCAGAPKLNGLALGADAVEACSCGFPKLNPPPEEGPGFNPSSAGFDPNKFVPDAPVLAPNADVVGGGPAGVVDDPKLKPGLVVGAGVVEPNSGVAEVVAGVFVEDLSGVPKPPNDSLGASLPPVLEPKRLGLEVELGFPKRLDVAGLLSVDPAAVVVVGAPKLKPPPVEVDVFPNKLPCAGLLPLLLEPNRFPPLPVFEEPKLKAIFAAVGVRNGSGRTGRVGLR